MQKNQFNLNKNNSFIGICYFIKKYVLNNNWWKNHYRHSEKDKIAGLKYLKENFYRETTLSANAKKHIHRWIYNADNACHYIILPIPDILIYTDASITGKL